MRTRRPPSSAHARLAGRGSRVTWTWTSARLCRVYMTGPVTTTSTPLPVAVGTVGQVRL